MDKLKNNSILLSLLIITFISILSYLPLTLFLGFYSEDIFFGYIAHFYGIEGIIKSSIIDRPFNGHTFALTYSLLGDNIFLWHVTTFLMRLIGGYLLFYLLYKIWPDRLSIITSITILFLVYPGFLQQTLPLGYQIYPMALIFILSSFIFSILAVQTKSKFKLPIFILLAILLQIATFLTLEFFIGMELLRLLLIGYILKSDLKKKVIYWSPYIFSLSVFILWRIFVFKSVRPETNINVVTSTYYSDPLWLLKIPLEIFYSAINTILLPYFLPLAIRIPRIPIENTIISLVAGILAGGLVVYYNNIVKNSIKKNDNLETKKFSKQILIIGLVSLLGSLLPIVLTGRTVRLMYVYDRYTITSIIAVTFILLGLLSFKLSPHIRNLIIAILISLSVTTHLMNGFLFAKNWEQQKNIWWQLYWRAPDIEKNTMLIFYFPPLTKNDLFTNIVNKVRWYRIYWVDYQLWAPGNLFFNYSKPPQNHFRGEFLEDNGITQKIKNKASEIIEDRGIVYQKDFNKAVIVSTPNDNSCLWVLDKNLKEFPQSYTLVLEETIEYSDTSKLAKANDSMLPPTKMFGYQPEKNWCYYFQKASLSRQLKDWRGLSSLTQEVIQKNLQPNDYNEWLPFIEGLIVSKNYSKAKDLINEGKSSVTFTENICKMLKRLKETNLKEIYCK